ncbi:MAG: hypothetical protein QOE47_2777, partial [Pyrinomonadaceae bacterium]|nr:hypothetical protein [Pyrinomonadaceae bacterium]
MKTFLVSLLFVAVVAVAPAAAQEHTPHDGHKPHDATKVEVARTETGGDVIKRGDALNGESPAVKFADVLKEPAKFAGKRVRIEGVVERVCQSE